MKIWILNNYNMLPEHGSLTRSYNLACALAEKGHDVSVFVGSHPHNTNLQLINDDSKYVLFRETPIKWYLVRTCNYESSKLKRVHSMFEYYRNVKKAVKTLETPDAIIGSSAHPLAALAAIKIGKKRKTKAIMEVRDLWPESIVDYGVLSGKNPIVKLLYAFEKSLYKRADAIVFTMEGGKQYIIDRGWDSEHGGPVELSKVYHINNGIDLHMFDRNVTENAVADPDLDNASTYKVVYTGSLKQANKQIWLLFDAIDLINKKGHNDFIFIFYGDGDERPKLEVFCKEKGIKNVVFKGRIEKKYIPYVLSKCNLNILNIQPSSILKYGGSQNKLFDYLASGHPIVSGEDSPYSIVRNESCGISRKFNSAEDVVSALMEIRNADYSFEHIRKVAMEYDFSVLADKLISIIEK